MTILGSCSPGRPVSRRVRARGPVKVAVRNRNRFTVAVRLSMRRAGRARSVVVRAKPFSVGAQAKKRVALRLPRAFGRVHERRRKVSVRLTLKAKDPAGNTRTVRKNVVLRRG